LAGLQALLMQVAWLHLILKLAGGAYLIYLGYRIWRGAHAPVVADDIVQAAGSDLRKSFALGLATQISNPKTAIVYAGIFAAFLPAHVPAWMFWTLPPLIFAIEAGWYSIVSVACSAPAPRAAYLGAKLWIDRIAGGVLGLLGGKLILEAVRGRIA
ncbi:MAG: LysE family translocator, partial [Dongiaceae bacterium]